MLQLQNCTHILDQTNTPATPSDRKCKQMVFHCGSKQQASYYRLSLLAICTPLNPVDCPTFYICFAAFCLVCFPTSCCVTGASAHLPRHAGSLPHDLLVYLCRRSFFFSPRIASYTRRCWSPHLLKYRDHAHVSSYLSRYEDACNIGNNGRGLMNMTRRTLSVQDGGWVFDCISSPPS